MLKNLVKEITQILYLKICKTQSKILLNLLYNCSKLNTEFTYNKEINLI